MSDSQLSSKTGKDNRLNNFRATNSFNSSSSMRSKSRHRPWPTKSALWGKWLKICISRPARKMPRLFELKCSSGMKRSKVVCVPPHPKPVCSTKAKNQVLPQSPLGFKIPITIHRVKVDAPSLPRPRKSSQMSKKATSKKLNTCRTSSKTRLARPRSTPTLKRPISRS